MILQYNLSLSTNFTTNVNKYRHKALFFCRKERLEKKESLEIACMVYAISRNSFFLNNKLDNTC